MNSDFRLYLKPLEPKDINDEYLSWHQNEEHIQYYSSSGRTFSKETLLKGKMDKSFRTYVIYNLWPGLVILTLQGPGFRPLNTTSRALRPNMHSQTALTFSKLRALNAFNRSSYIKVENWTG